MKHRQEGNRLYLKVEQNLNLITAGHIERLAAESGEVHLDLSDARIVDSEGVILLWRLLRERKKVLLWRPPRILSEMIDILELEELLPLEEMLGQPFEERKDVETG